MKYQLGVNSVVRKKATPKVNLGNIPKNYESPFYSGQEKNYLGTGENYKTFGGYFDTKRGSFGAETWLDQANNLSPSIYGTYSKEIKPNLSLDASVGINDKYVGLGLTKTFSKGGVSLKTNTKTVKQDGSKKLKALSKKHLGDIYESETNNSQGFDYWKEKFMKDNNLSEEQAINLIDDIRNEQRLRGVSDKIYKYKNPLVKSSESFVPEYTPPYNKYVDMKTLNAKKPQKSVMGEDYFVSGAKSVKKYRGDENLPEAKKGMKNCGCKHSRSKYKYQSGERDIAADKLEYGDNYETALANTSNKELELPTEGDVAIVYNLPAQEKNKTKPVKIKKTPIKTSPVINDENSFNENKILKNRLNYLKGLEERSRKQDSTYYANNIGRQIDEAVRNNTRVYVTENREGKPLKGKKSGDNTCITGVCNVAKKAGAKIPFNSTLAEDRNSFGDNPIETRYNPAFRDNAAKMGFKLLPQNAKLQRGDIVQLNERGTPHHAMLYYDESAFGTDAGNEDDGRSWFGFGPKKDLGFEKRWMGPFSNRTSSSINPIAKNALAYRYVGVPSKKTSMQEAVAYTKAEKAKYLKRQNLLAKKNAKQIPEQVDVNNEPLLQELVFQKNGNKNIMSNKLNKYKYKYGTGALTIPEGSAIVTANGGKNMQALKAYKKGNYKLLNKIIDDMPEDNVNKKQGGTNNLETRYKTLGELTGPLSEEQAKEFEELKKKLTETTYDLYDDKRIAEKFGQQYDVDRPEFRSSLQGGKLSLKENTENANYRNRLRTEPKYFQEELNAGRVQIDKDGNVTYTAKGEFKEGKPEFLGTSKKGTLPQLSIPAQSNIKPQSVKDNLNKDNINNRRRGFNVPAMAEIAARSSILGKGIEGVPENYLNLDRYSYASQLPKTLREIQLSEQAGRETARDIVAGDAGRYLAQTGNLSAARMKAANEAVIQDTLARQDILNKNVDLSNIELQTNRGLKDQYAALRGQARANYNDQLVSLGQRIDSATETAQEMSNQRNMDQQRLQILKDLGVNYDFKNLDGLLKLLPKTAAKGLKKAKTYKRK